MIHGTHVSMPVANMCSTETVCFQQNHWLATVAAGSLKGTVLHASPFFAAAAERSGQRTAMGTNHLFICSVFLSEMNTHAGTARV
jgi:hypothetical protein